MKKVTTAERLKEIMNERQIKQVDILTACRPYCEKFSIKIGKNDLSQYVSGKVSPRQDKLTILALALDVNEVWLMGYDVPEERHALDQKIQGCDLYPLCHDSGAYDLVSSFLKLDAEDKTTITEMIGVLLKKDKYREKEAICG